jgi:uncharacterized membrane protein YccC
MSKHQLITAAIAVATVAISLGLGSHRRAALVGVTISGLTALASILAMGRTARAKKPVQAALAVMTVTFLLRLVLVSIGTILVARAREDAIAFVIAFFITYFVYAAIEAGFVHTLSRGTGPTA